MRIVVEETARGVAPEWALAWWSDFRNGREDHAFFPATERRILDRSADEVRIEERARPLGIPLFTEQLTARIGANAVTFDGVNTYTRFRGSYAFEPVAEGTRVRLDAAMDLKVGLRWTRPLAEPIAFRLLRADLRGHVREMERDSRDPNGRA